MLILLHKLDGKSFTVNTDSIKRVSIYDRGMNINILEFSDGGKPQDIKEFPEDVMRLEQEAYEKTNRKGDWK